MLDAVDGMTPDQKLHETYFIINPVRRSNILYILRFRYYGKIKNSFKEKSAEENLWSRMWVPILKCGSGAQRTRLRKFTNVQKKKQRKCSSVYKRCTFVGGRTSLESRKRYNQNSILVNNTNKKRPRGRPNRRWLDVVKRRMTDLRPQWNEDSAYNRDEWKKSVLTAKGPRMVYNA